MKKFKRDIFYHYFLFFMFFVAKVPKRMIIIYDLMTKPVISLIT
jgi:hypothetical protein